MTIIKSTRLRMAVGLLVAAGLAVASASPALADRKHKNWQHDHGKHHSHNHRYDEVRYYDGPDVIYVQPRPVVVRERVYVQPATVYYEPSPVIYQRPSINIIVPLFD